MLHLQGLRQVYFRPFSLIFWLMFHSSTCLFYFDFLHFVIFPFVMFGW